MSRPNPPLGLRRRERLAITLRLLCRGIVELYGLRRGFRLVVVALRFRIVFPPVGLTISREAGPGLISFTVLAIIALHHSRLRILLVMNAVRLYCVRAAINMHETVTIDPERRTLSRLFPEFMEIYRRGRLP